MYQIESKSNTHDWSDDYVGDSNEFETVADAEAMIPELRKLGPDWAAAEYRVVPAD